MFDSFDITVRVMGYVVDMEVNATASERDRKIYAPLFTLPQNVVVPKNTKFNVGMSLHDDDKSR